MIMRNKKKVSSVSFKDVNMDKVLIIIFQSKIDYLKKQRDLRKSLAILRVENHWKNKQPLVFFILKKKIKGLPRLIVGTLFLMGKGYRINSWLGSQGP